MFVACFPACKGMFPRMVSSEATGMPEGKRMRGNTINVPRRALSLVKFTSLPDEEQSTIGAFALFTC